MARQISHPTAPTTSGTRYFRLKVEAAYRDYRYDPPATKRLVFRDDAQLGRWLTLHGEHVELIATTTEF